MNEPTTHQAHTVHMREHWTDEWELQDHVYCDQFSLVAGPDVSEATLSYNYGIVQPFDSQSVSSRSKKSINGWYVKVTLNQFTEDDDETVQRWYGVIVETSDDRYGRVTSNDVTADSGRQTFHCRGLEFLLQRSIVDTSAVYLADELEAEIGRAIGFNLGSGRSTDHERHGNKSTTPGEMDAPIFAFTIGAGGVVTSSEETTWSVQDIIEYLFAYHPPKDAGGLDWLKWQVADGGDAEILSKIHPLVHAHGKTVFELLAELIDRRRLVGYTIDVVDDDGDESAKLNIFTFNKEAIELPGGATIPPNSNQQTWYFDDDAAVRAAVVNEDDATRFDVVIVRGEQLGACFTVSNSLEFVEGFGESLVKDWDDTLEDRYNDGASASGPYASLADIDKQAANQAFRADDVFAKVYRAFILSSDFDGYVDDVTVCPDPREEEADGTPSETSATCWHPGLRFLDRLPLRTDYDYSTVENFEATGLTIESSQPNYLRPFAVARVRKDESAGPLDDTNSRYYLMDSPGHGNLTSRLLKANGIKWSASVRMQDNCPGVLIDVQGAPQHIIAEDEFNPADDADNDETDGLTIDWKDILVTVFCEFDQYVEAKYPAEELTTDTDAVRELIINVPGMRLDYLAPNTVVGIDDAGALLETDGGYVRDDRALMSDIARCAAAWYGQTRKALTVTRHSLVCEHSIGELITYIGSATNQVEVNSVVTKIVFDVKAGNVTVFTQYAELDVVGR